MDLPTEVVDLVQALASDEPELVGTLAALEMNRDDILLSLRANRDPRSLFEEGSRVTGTSEFGLGEVTGVLTLITLIWKTYEVAKGFSSEAKRLAGSVRVPNPAAEQMWREVLEKDAKLP